MFRLKEIRQECGMKRSELARALNMNAGTIANYENEIRQAPYEYIIRFAEFFDVSTDYLLGRAEGERPAPGGGVKLAADEMQLIDDYRAIGRAGKEHVRELAELLRGAGR